MITPELIWKDYLSGNEQSLNTLVERFEHDLFYYILSFVQDRGYAQDVEQEVWIKISRYQREVHNFEGLLFTSAKHKAIDFIRKEKRNLVALEYANHIADGERSDNLLNREDYDKLIHKEDRELWSLHEQGYNNNEIALILDTSQKSVANKKSIIRNYLKDKLNNKMIWMITLMTELI